MFDILIMEYKYCIYLLILKRIININYFIDSIDINELGLIYWFNNR
jgi:hypothetical protein